jgi:hypothetical protein
LGNFFSWQVAWITVHILYLWFSVGKHLILISASYLPSELGNLGNLDKTASHMLITWKTGTYHHGRRRMTAKFLINV